MRAGGLRSGAAVPRYPGGHGPAGADPRWRTAGARTDRDAVPRWREGEAVCGRTADRRYVATTAGGCGKVLGPHRDPAVVTFAGFMHTWVTCDRCAARPVGERSIRLRLLPVGVRRPRPARWAAMRGSAAAPGPAPG